jgi:hypothetical protein
MLSGFQVSRGADGNLAGVVQDPLLPGQVLGPWPFIPTELRSLDSPHLCFVTLDRPHFLGLPQCSDM